MKKIFENICVIFLVFCLMLLLSGCEINNENSSILEKVEEEINYLEDTLLVVINKYEKDEYSAEENLNWKDIKNDVLEINNVLDTIVLDLSEIEISNEKIIEFKNSVNNLEIAVSNENEEETLKNLAIVYELLPQMIEKITDKDIIERLEIKSLIISSMITANNLDFENSKQFVKNAEEKYNRLMSDNQYIEKYSYNLNKVYVLLEEFKNAIDIEEVNLAKIKYINFIENI